MSPPELFRACWLLAVTVLDAMTTATQVGRPRYGYPMTELSEIDVDYNFFDDTPEGKGPDAHSQRLREYHQLLWSKPLRDGRMFELTRSKSLSPYLIYEAEGSRSAGTTPVSRARSWTFSNASQHSSTCSAVSKAMRSTSCCRTSSTRQEQRAFCFCSTTSLDRCYRQTSPLVVSTWAKVLSCSKRAVIEFWDRCKRV